ncbi:Uncharacterised protein [Legionella pneumophila]|nr:hypothetical protein N748_07280 [Legionella pneumophila str. 121004]ERH44294.1 hypothetical protein N751_14415 [Legionella pneumophila str. Leg01/11]ERI46982.1 hypothetical protein N749_16280 [Legionella pneumophila str. Leg01/20]CAH13553.1 hypothetical protein lpp2400 [Legionella pneumophila str. Paris]CZG90408.1 Uncharacterised protein [Legionella pneumophila]
MHYIILAEQDYLQSCLSVVLFIKDVIVKKLIFILLCFPTMIFANPAQESKNIETFKQLCKNGKDVSMREHYCKLLEQQKKAEAIFKDFEKNKSST